LKALQLTEAANKAGGKDNLGFHVVRFFTSEEKKGKDKRNKMQKSNEKKPVKKIISYVLLFILAVVVGYFTYQLFFSSGSLQMANTQDDKMKVEENETQDVVEYDSIDSELMNPTDEVSDEEKLPEATEKVPVKEPAFQEDVFLEHQIQSGENFYRLGIRFGITVKELETVNNIEATKLQANQVVKIPIKAIHKVVKGEILSSIAEDYNCPIERIKRANKLESNNLSLGQELYIPKTYN